MHVPGSGNGSIGCGSKFYAVLPHSWALKGGTRAIVRSGRQVGSTCSARQAGGCGTPRPGEVDRSGGQASRGVKRGHAGTESEK